MQFLHFFSHPFLPIHVICIAWTLLILITFILYTDFYLVFISLLSILLSVSFYGFLCYGLTSLTWLKIMLHELLREGVIATTRSKMLSWCIFASELGMKLMGLILFPWRCHCPHGLILNYIYFFLTQKKCPGGNGIPRVSEIQVNKLATHLLIDCNLMQLGFFPTDIL